MSGARLPPDLLYFTIYNPTLHPSDLVDKDNEDAEEQAHILFYTAKERAVSRDRILRQVGLAKALVNFAEMFSPNDPCNNIHSQTRRMIMVSPEPNFWIHAAVELARFPRPPPAKGKSKAKPAEKGKEKDAGPQFDYEDSPTLDAALRAEMLRGYEMFKLRHGSFTAILSRLGQEALELQLERFFTVWAWTWDIENGHEFLEQLGSPLHPAYPSLKSAVDTFTSSLPDNIHPIILTPSYAIPSTRFRSARYPSSLARHLLSIIPSEPGPVPDLMSSVETIKGKDQAAKSNGGNQNTFLGMPISKWNWLPFGKSASNPSEIVLPTEEKKEEAPDDNVQTSTIEVQVDKSALDDAMSSDSVSLHPSSPESEDHNKDGKQVADAALETATEPPRDEDRGNSVVDVISDPSMHGDPSPEDPVVEECEEEEEESALRAPLPDFIPYTIHLAPSDDPIATIPQKCFYVIQKQFMLALLGIKVGKDHTPIEGQLDSAIENTFTFFDEIETLIRDEKAKKMSESLPSANKILQPQDRHIISSDSFTTSSDNFSSKSGHLYHAKALEDANPDIMEVFSRGQNPQHWHIAKRGLRSVDDDDEGRVYMEVFRKETSLTDVDNVLAGVVRRAGLVEGFS